MEYKSERGRLSSFLFIYETDYFEIMLQKKSQLLGIYSWINFFGSFLVFRRSQSPINHEKF